MTDGKVREAARGARKASLALGALSTEVRNAALEAMAKAVDARRDEILRENAKDVEAAKVLVGKGEITSAAAKRLDLSNKIDGVIDSLRSVAALPDPIGRVLFAVEMDEGLELERVSCPIGVIAVIFESRPDALPQIASLCLKTGNAVLMKGGSEALQSNRVLARVLDEAARSAGIPEGWMTLLETRQDIAEILSLDDYIDLIIPRGSNEFVRYIMDNTKIPVTGHRDGVCHTYIHTDADPAKAIRIAVDAKTQYVAVCNATECLLVDAACAEAILPAVACAMVEKNVELRCDPRALRILQDYAKARGQACDKEQCLYRSKVKPAVETDWGFEFLELILAVRVVDGLGEAIDFINTHGSHHTDAIVTEDAAAAREFMQRVDSSSVMHNVSTRFADGFNYGLGAEVGISTEKIHSRGPVGLEGLTIYKYLIHGSGQVKGDYSDDGGRKFTHKLRG
jgi:glutamate-5-semialdehyde dehydrogenase